MKNQYLYLKNSILRSLRWFLKKLKKKEKKVLCVKCLGLDEIIELQCGHKYCQDCLVKITKTAFSNRLLPEYPLANCYNIYDKNAFSFLVEIRCLHDEILQKSDPCLICGGKENFLQYHSEHTVCEKCFKGQNEYITKGIIFIPKSGTTTMKDLNFLSLPCPVRKCRIPIPSSEIKKLYTSEEYGKLCSIGLESRQIIKVSDNQYTIKNRVNMFF